MLRKIKLSEVRICCILSSYKTLRAYLVNLHMIHFITWFNITIKCSYTKANDKFMKSSKGLKIERR